MLRHILRMCPTNLTHYYGFQPAQGIILTYPKIGRARLALGRPTFQWGIKHLLAILRRLLEVSFNTSRSFFIRMVLVIGPLY